MYKTVIKTIDIMGPSIEGPIYDDFRNNEKWNNDYVDTLVNQGYKSEYIAIDDDKIISLKYTSLLWLMALRVIYEKFINQDLNSAPDGVIIQSIDSSISLNVRSNQKWLVQVMYIYKCSECKSLFDNQCKCLLES